MSDELLPILMKIGSDVGELKGMVSSANAIMTRHLTDDSLVEARVSVLEKSHARSIGAHRVLLAIGTSLGGGAGAIVHSLLHK